MANHYLQAMHSITLKGHTTVQYANVVLIHQKEILHMSVTSNLPNH